MPATPDLWDDFCERLKRAGRVIHRETTPTDELTVAEGYRKLVHLIRIGFECTVDFADTEHPRVYQGVTPTTLGEGETSDARYHQAFIDGAVPYWLSGTRGTAPLIEFTVYAGKLGLEDESRQIAGLTERELIVDPNGTFTVVLSPDPHPGNWIRTTPEVTFLFIRQYAHDWRSTQSATFEMRRAGAAPHAPPLDLQRIRHGLERTAAYVEKAASFWPALADHYATVARNVFREVPVDMKAMMPSGHRFSTGYFRFAPGEAILVTFAPSDVPYWGLDVTNYWYEPLSYEDHRSHVNNRTVAYESDGSVRIVIAAQRPAAANWIDTQGHYEGTMLLRWSRSEQPIPPVAARVVKLVDV